VAVVNSLGPSVAWTAWARSAGAGAAAAVGVGETPGGGPTEGMPAPTRWTAASRAGNWTTAVEPGVAVQAE
jgi:hypothetical protein